MPKSHQPRGAPGEGFGCDTLSVGIRGVHRSRNGHAHSLYTYVYAPCVALGRSSLTTTVQIDAKGTFQFFMYPMGPEHLTVACRHSHDSQETGPGGRLH
jgi:hypothetical protein